MNRNSPAVGGPPLVGRARELGALRDRLDRVVAGTGSTVLVTGEAGIGKSRLIREITAEATSRGWSTIDGRCVAVGPEPLRRAALLDLLRSASAGPSGSGLATASTEELLERVLDLVDSAASAAPLLVVVEDVHWADRATCEVLMVLARHVHDCPACLVMASRDDELPPDHHVRGFLAELRRAQLVTDVALPRLGAADVATLIQNLVGPIEKGLAAAVFDRSAGIRCSWRSSARPIRRARFRPTSSTSSSPGPIGSRAPRWMWPLQSRPPGTSSTRHCWPRYCPAI